MNDHTKNEIPNTNGLLSLHKPAGETALGRKQQRENQFNQFAAALKPEPSVPYALVPELHLVTVSSPVFSIITADGIRRCYICLGIAPRMMKIAVLVEDGVEGAQVFMFMPEPGHEYEQRRRFLGTALQTATHDREQLLEEDHLIPSHKDFNLLDWRDIEDAPPFEIVYLLDAQEKMALGIVDDEHGIDILSAAPGEFVAVKFHFAKASRMKGAAAS